MTTTVESLESVKYEVKYLKTEILTLSAELKEFKADTRNDYVDLKTKQDDLLKFMYRFEGGKASLFALLAAAASFGSILGILSQSLFTK